MASRRRAAGRAVDAGASGVASPRGSVGTRTDLSSRGPQAWRAQWPPRMPTPRARAWHSWRSWAGTRPDRCFAQECHAGAWHSWAPPGARLSHRAGLLGDNADRGTAEDGSGAARRWGYPPAGVKPAGGPTSEPLVATTERTRQGGRLSPRQSYFGGSAARSPSWRGLVPAHSATSGMWTMAKEVWIG